MPALPITIFCRWRQRVALIGSAFFGMTATGNDTNVWQLASRTTGVARFTASNVVLDTTAAAPDVDEVWHSSAGVSRTSTDRSVYLDGTNRTNAATTANPSASPWAICVGARPSLTPALFTTHAVRDCAFWNVALSDGEIAWLHMTASFPLSILRIRPANLVCYYPLRADSSFLRDFGPNGYHLTETATTWNYPEVPPLPRLIPAWKAAATAASLLYSPSRRLAAVR